MKYVMLFNLKLHIQHKHSGLSGEDVKSFGEVLKNSFTKKARQVGSNAVSSPFLLTGLVGI